jgi:hypothetical protein
MSSLALSRHLMTVYIAIFSLLAITVSSSFRNNSTAWHSDQKRMMAAGAKTSTDDRRERSELVLNREENSELTPVDHVDTGSAGVSDETENSRHVSETNDAPAVEFTDQDVTPLLSVTSPVSGNADSGSLTNEFLRHESNPDRRTDDSEVDRRSSVFDPVSIDESSSDASGQMAVDMATELNESESEGRPLKPASRINAAGILLTDNSDDAGEYRRTPEATTIGETQQKSLPEMTIVTSPSQGVNEANLNSAEVPSEVEFQFSEPAELNSGLKNVELPLTGSLEDVLLGPVHSDAASSGEVVPLLSELPAQTLGPIAATAIVESTRIDEEPIIEPAGRASRGESRKPSRPELHSDSVVDAPMIIPKSRDAEFPGRAVAVIDPAANRRGSKPVPNRLPAEVPAWREIDTASTKDSAPFVVPPIPSSDELVVAGTLATDSKPGVPEPGLFKGAPIAPLLPVPAAHLNSVPADVSQPQRYLGATRRQTVPPGILTGMQQRLSGRSDPVATPDTVTPGWMDRMANRVEAIRAGGKSVAGRSEKPQSRSSTGLPRRLIPQKKVPGQNLQQSQHALGKQGMTRQLPTNPQHRPDVFPPELKRFIPEVAATDAERRKFRLPDLKMPSLYLPTWSVSQPRDLSRGTWEIRPYIVELDLPMPEVPQLPEWLVDLPDADPLEPLRNSAAVHRVSSTIRYAADSKVVR